MLIGQHLTSDLDIYRSARVLVGQHGDDAPIHAAMRVDAMLEAGDLAGRAVWVADTQGSRGVDFQGAA